MGETLTSICRDEHMPATSAVREWRSTDAELYGNIACARELGFDAIAERTQEIARGTSVESTGDVQRDKLIIETDLKLLAKWDPKRYGDRIQVDATVKDARAMTDAEIDAEIVRLTHGKGGD